MMKNDFISASCARSDFSMMMLSVSSFASHFPLESSKRRRRDHVLGDRHGAQITVRASNRTCLGSKVEKFHAELGRNIRHS